MLELSNEKIDEFKELLVDRQIDITNFRSMIWSASSEKKKAEVKQRLKEIRGKYNNSFRELLGNYILLKMLPIIYLYQKMKMGA